MFSDLYMAKCLAKGVRRIRAEYAYLITRGIGLDTGVRRGCNCTPEGVQLHPWKL